MDIGNQINEKPAKPFKNVLMIMAVVIVLFLVWFWFSQSNKTNEEVVPSIPENQDQMVENTVTDDSTSSIMNDLEGIDINDLEGEFKDIDADLNNL